MTSLPVNPETAREDGFPLSEHAEALYDALLGDDLGDDITLNTALAHAHVLANDLPPLLAELAGLRTALTEMRSLAKSAQSQAAAPDYDEAAIKDALWALVGRALAVSVTPPEEPS